MPHLHLVRHFSLRLRKPNANNKSEFPMKVTFQIDYHTGWGESMHVIGSLPCLSEGQAMTATPDGMQTVTVEISPAQGVFDYGYEVHRDDGTVRREWGHRRRLRLDSHLTSVLVHDHWKETPSDKPFYSSAFTEAIFRHERDKHIRSTKAATLEIKVDAPEVPAEAVVAIVGGCEALGFWDPQHARVLEPVEAPEWRITLPMESLPDRFEFKFLLLRKSDRSILAWERSDNRVFNRPTLGANGAMIIAGLYLESPMEKWRGSGTAIPVFALRSEQGFGTGEFADIRKMVDWAVATGQQFIQLLPINDTTMTHTWTDSYPYTTNSTFALHPMYLRLEDVGSLPSPELKEEYDRLREELNQLPTLDYERVNAAKLRLSRILFDSQGEAEMTSRAFQEFAVRNDGWLTPYAVWCVLRDRFGTPDMDLWGEYAQCTDAVIERVTTENRKDVDYFRFIQYHLDKQLRQACDYAHEHGVVLKGDIPIGISRCSVDAWRYPELFNFTCTAGAPPDDFATFGQNWGFPTYRWDVMARDGYKWWRERLMKMAEYFSAYRIDHLLGFFRIWQIPADTLHGLDRKSVV